MAVASETDRAAATAAAQVARAGALVGALGVLSCAFVMARLLETWRVSPGVAAHHRISIFDLRLSYPAANLGAVVVLLLALIGATATAMILRGAADEVLRSRRLRRLIAARELHEHGGASVIEDPCPRAFCAGLLRPIVYISTGALALLDEDELSAVLLHEQHHARRRDPLRLAASRALARALFFLPWLSELARRHQELAELSADEWAITIAPDCRSALARAMLSFADAPESFADAPESSREVGIDPARVDRLLGEEPHWCFPTGLCLAAVCVLAAIVAVAILAGNVASGAATLAPPLLSRQPCVVVLALIPAGLGLFTLSLGRRVRSRRRAAGCLGR